MVLPRLAGAQAGSTGALESFGLGERDERSQGILQKFSQLIETVTAIRDKNTTLLDGIKKIFSPKSKEKRPEQQRIEEEQKDRFEKLYDVLVDIRDGMLDGGGIGKKGFLSKMKDMLGGGKSIFQTMLDNPLTTALLAGSFAPLLTSLVGLIKAGIVKVFGSAGAALGFAKFLGIAAVVVDNIIDGVKGYFKSSEWGISPLLGTISSVLGGSGSGWVNALYKAGTFAFLGAKMGSLFGLPGAIIGGIAGGLIGGIAGYFGEDKVAEFFQKVNTEGLWVAVKDAVLELLEALMAWVRREILGYKNRSPNEIITDTVSNLEKQETTVGPKVDVVGNYDPSKKQQAPQDDFNKYRTDQPVQGPKPEPKPTSKDTQTNRGSAGAKIVDKRNAIDQNGHAMAATSIIHDSNLIDSLEGKKFTREEGATLTAIQQMENAEGKGWDRAAQVYRPYTDVDKDKSLAIAHGHHFIPVDLSDLEGDVSNKNIPLRKVETKDSLTKEQSDKLLEYRFKGFTKQIANSTHYKNFYMQLPAAIRATLSNMAYQMGLGKLNNFEGMRKSLEAYTKDPKQKHLDDAAGHIQYVNGVDGTFTPLYDQTPRRAEAYQRSIRENRVYTLKYNHESQRREPTIVPYQGPMAKGYIAKKPSLIMTGEYRGAEENPEVTIQMNALENRILATTNRLFKMKEDMEKKDNTILSSTFQNKLEKTVENTRISEERVQMKDMIQRNAMQIQMPVMNSVVDNKVINNTSNPILIQKTSRNEHNPFRMS